MYNSKLYWTLFLILGSTITGYISIAAFTSLLGIPIGITSSSIGLKIYAIIAGTNKYKSRNKKHRKKHDKIVLSAKSKLNNIEVLIFKASNITHDEFVLINNVLKEHNDMKE